MLPSHASRFSVAFTAVFLLALNGCATTQPPQEDAAAVVDRQILSLATSVSGALNELHQAGAVNEVAAKKPLSIKSNDQTLDLVWKGDAAQLLQRLATDRGLAFATTGVRLPLPVNINAANESYEWVLQRVQAQIGYRAVVAQASSRLILQYNAPQP
jgi:defect in organelle trafficking protein DotD